MYIDMALLPKVCFHSGMPMIVVDLLVYLCGGYFKGRQEDRGDKGKEQRREVAGDKIESLVRQAMRGIRERAPAR